MPVDIRRRVVAEALALGGASIVWLVGLKRFPIEGTVWCLPLAAAAGCLYIGLRRLLLRTLPIEPVLDQAVFASSDFGVVLMIGVTGGLGVSAAGDWLLDRLSASSWPARLILMSMGFAAVMPLSIRAARAIAVRRASSAAKANNLKAAIAVGILLLYLAIFAVLLCRDQWN